MTHFMDEIMNASPVESVKKNLLIMADCLVARLSPDTSEEDMVKSFADIAMLCFADACKLVSNEITRKTLDNAVRVGDGLWNYVAKYVKDVHGIEMHPLGLLMILYQAASYTDETHTVNTRLQDIIKKIIDLKARDAAEDIKPGEVVPIQEIEVDPRSVDDLVREYFKLMEEIGTFYRDRSKYETDDKRDLHDRIVAIYSKIIRKM